MKFIFIFIFLTFNTPLSLRAQNENMFDLNIGFTLVYKSALQDYIEFERNIASLKYSELISHADSMLESLNTFDLNQIDDSGHLLYQEINQDFLDDTKNYYKELIDSLKKGNLTEGQREYFKVEYFFYSCDCLHSKLWFIQPRIYFSQNYLEELQEINPNFNKIVNFEVKLEEFTPLKSTGSQYLLIDKINIRNILDNFKIDQSNNENMYMAYLLNLALNEDLELYVIF